ARRLKALNGLNRDAQASQTGNPNPIPPQSSGPPSNNPEGIAPSSPGLRGTSYPGIKLSDVPNPERVAPDPRPLSVHAQMVGLLLPPSVGGALANFAVMLMGKVPVNLNYTVSEETLNSCIRQCEIKTVISSKAFLEKVKLKIPVETVFLEDLSAKPGRA